MYDDTRRVCGRYAVACYGLASMVLSVVGQICYHLAEMNRRVFRKGSDVETDVACRNSKQYPFGNLPCEYPQYTILDMAGLSDRHKNGNWCLKLISMRHKLYFS
jgi:hypothetical protein